MGADTFTQNKKSLCNRIYLNFHFLRLLERPKFQINSFSKKSYRDPLLRKIIFHKIYQCICVGNNEIHDGRVINAKPKGFDSEPVYSEIYLKMYLK